MLLSETIDRLKSFTGEDFTNWFNDTNNICFIEDNDIALFTYERPGVYSGHYFYESKGRRAIDLSFSFLRFMFTEHGAEVIMGLTPTENRPARWITRHLGFKSKGVLSTPKGDMELFVLSKKEFING